MFGSGVTTLIFSDEEMNNIMKIVKSLEKQKNKKADFSVLLGTLGASLLGNLLTGKATIRAGEGKIRAGQDF